MIEIGILDTLKSLAVVKSVLRKLQNSETLPWINFPQAGEISNTGLIHKYYCTSISHIRHSSVSPSPSRSLSSENIRGHTHVLGQ